MRLNHIIHNQRRFICAYSTRLFIDSDLLLISFAYVYISKGEKKKVRADFSFISFFLYAHVRFGSGRH